MRIAYIECSSGASGDMLLAGLIDAGASEPFVRDALDALRVEGWSLALEETRRSGIRALRAQVETSDSVTSRTYTDIVNLLEAAPLSPKVRQRSLRTFEILGRAEARVHGVDISQVHFHEVGGVDAIVDIVGGCAALASLSVDRVLVSPIATGTGTAPSAHGHLPLPAPAVTEIFKGTKASLVGRGQRELITPTGAALLAAAADDFGSLPHMSIEATGYGAGSAELDFPNVVRVIVGTLVAGKEAGPEEVVLIETNIDDMSPELFPHVLDRLLQAGAQDAWITPIVMKKGRPAFTLSALCRKKSQIEVTKVFFNETTTLGLRISEVSKHELEREWLSTTIEGNPVRVKVARDNGIVTTLAPEHDDAAKAARKLGLPLRDIYAHAIRDAERLLPND